MKIHIMIVAALLLFIPLSSASADGDADEGIRLSEVFPQHEGFSLKNYSRNAVDLGRYEVTDGEGAVTVAYLLGGGCSITFIRSERTGWITVGREFSDGAVNGAFQLNDDGDDLVLKKGRTVVDSFIYGSGNPAGGWSGDPFQKITKNRYAERASSIDTDSSMDWIETIPGDGFERSDFHASVIPFTFPESSGGPVMDALTEAKDEVLISIYIMDHPDIVSILLALLISGVDVSILIDGSPAGGVPEREIAYMATLSDAGADVMVMKTTDGFKRFSYNHGKYAVIDSNTVVITSENWRVSSFTGNRGWGCIATSDGLGSYMRNVFLADSDMRYGDVRMFRDIYEGASSLRPPVYEHELKGYDLYEAFVTPIVGPSLSFPVVLDAVASAKTRLYVQQMGIDISWVHGKIVEAMRNSGADVRIMVDVTFDSPYDEDSNDGYWLKEMLPLNIRTTDDCPIEWYMHNKGIISDDSVVVGSLNWNDSSFRNNREVGLLIHSKEVADIMSDVFLDDWGYDGHVIPLAEVGIHGKEVVLDASHSSMPLDAVVGWDFDSDGVIDRHGVKIAVRMDHGWNACTLIIIADGVEYMKEVHVFISGDGAKIDLGYVPMIAVCAIIIAVRVFRRRDDT